MQDWVRRKLDKIDELFPTARINRSKKRWTYMWNAEIPEDRYPYLTDVPLFNPYNINHSKEERLKVYLDACIFMGKLDDDFIPSIFPGCNQATIPTMFGAKPKQVGLETTCEKIIMDSKSIDMLPEPSMGTSTLAYHWLEMQDYIINETEGRIPVHVCDMQGPMDVCGQLWGYDNLFLGAYDSPEYFHMLINKVSEAFIMLWKEQEKICGDAFVGTHLFSWDWVPKNNGASLSADSLVMVSPDFYDEFYKPHLEMIGNEFNGLSVHSCGNFGAVVPNMCKTKNLKAINASQMTVKQLVDSGLHNDKVVISMLRADELKRNMEIIRQNQLGACITVLNTWPTENDKMNNPDSLDDDDWNEIFKSQDEIKNMMRV